MTKNDEKPFYVYNVFYRGILVYIGKGKGRRWEHVANGRSANELINDFYFRNKYFSDVNLEVNIPVRFKTDLQARKEESKQIAIHKPLCNKVAGRGHTNEYDFKDKLYEVAELLRKDKPDNIWSKFDFSFLFTPKGLICQSVSLSDNSVFEYTGEDYYIRLKKDCYKYFPEYFVRFAKFYSEARTEFWTWFGIRNMYIQSLEIGIEKLSEYGDLDWHIKAIDSKYFKHINGDTREFKLNKYLENCK